MESPTVSSVSSKSLPPDRWVQAFITGRVDLTTLPDQLLAMRRPMRQWLTRWRGLTREERMALITLIGAIGELVDAEQLLKHGEAIEDDPNVAADWRETVLGAIDATIDRIEGRERERMRLASASG